MISKLLTSAFPKPALMGIVNVTPDSFSDGGRYFSHETAIKHALALAKDRVDIVDIGGESSRPGALSVDEKEELRRVIPVVEGIRKKSEIPISIDTTKSSVARAAIMAGANMINDISAGRLDPRIFAVAVKYNVPICLMHMQGVPRTMQDAPHYKDIIGEIKSFLEKVSKRAMAAGIDRSQIVIDPGIGFGKSPTDNVKILKSLRSFAMLGFPLLVGTSRKSFFGKLLGHDLGKRLEGTLATLAVAVDAGVAIFRVHNVAAARRFLDTYLLCRNLTVMDLGV